MDLSVGRPQEAVAQAPTIEAVSTGHDPTQELKVQGNIGPVVPAVG